MTISITNSFATKLGDGTTTVFSVNSAGSGIYFADNAEIIVRLRSGSTITPQVEGTHYTLTGAGTNTGEITFITAPTDGTYIDIARATALTQTLNLAAGSEFSPANVMAAFDKLTRIAQDLAEGYFREWRGAWATATAYTAGNSVTNDGATYRAIAGHTSASSTEPGTGANWQTYWTLSAAAGVDGTDGADGADGTNGTNGTNGTDGATQDIFVQASEPATTGLDGSLWIDSDSTDYDLYTLSSGAWSNTGLNLKGPAGAGTGDMLASTYDPATIAEQLVGLAATQTLINKTLTSPTINSGTINTPTMILADANGAAPTADGEIKFDRTGENLEVGDGAATKSFSHDTGTATLQNKSIDLANNTVTGSTAQFNTALSDGSFATLAGTETFSNKTITSPVINTSVSGSAIATAGEYRDNTASKILTTDQVWSAMSEVTLTDAATIAVDMDSGFDFTVTLAGNRTLGNPTNVTVGQRGRIRVVQDGSGSRTLAYAANWEFAGGVAPSLTATISAEDVLFYDCISATRILLTWIGDIS